MTAAEDHVLIRPFEHLVAPVVQHEDPGPAVGHDVSAKAVAAAEAGHLGDEVADGVGELDGVVGPHDHVVFQDVVLAAVDLDALARDPQITLP